MHDEITKYDTSSILSRTELMDTIREQKTIIESQDQSLKQHIAYCTSMEASYRAKIGTLEKKISSQKFMGIAIAVSVIVCAFLLKISAFVQ